MGALAHDRGGAGLRDARRPAGAQGPACDAPKASALEDPRRARSDDARQLRRLQAEEQTARQIEVIEGLRDRYPTVVVEDKGEVFNSDLTQALELGYLLDIASCSSRPGCARGEPRRPLRPTTTRRATTRTSCATLRPAGSTARRSPRRRMCASPNISHRSENTDEVGLKIWRDDSTTGNRALKEYEVDAPEEATLLDCLDIVKDRLDGSLAYRKSCRMTICGSCGMRMDGGAVLACKVRMFDIANAGHVPAISATGNRPIVKDLVVDMDPFWAKFEGGGAVAAAGRRPAAGRRGTRDLAGADDVIHKESLWINCGCCVSEPTRRSRNRSSSAGKRSRRGCASSATCATPRRRSGSTSTAPSRIGTAPAATSGRALPEGRRSTRSIAKLGAEATNPWIDEDMGAKHASCSSTRRTDRLASPARARPEDAGDRLLDQGDEVRDGSGGQREGAAALPAACRRGGQERARSISSCRSRASTAPWDRPGRVGALAARARDGHAAGGGGDSGVGSRDQADASPGEQPTKKPGGGARIASPTTRVACLALGEGARHLHAGALAEGGP